MNELKLIIEENFINTKKINIIENKEIELVSKYNILFNNMQSKVVLSKFNKETEHKINECFTSMLPINKTLWNIFPSFNKKQTSGEIYKKSLIKTVNTVEELNDYDEYFIIVFKYFFWTF